MPRKALTEAQKEYIINQRLLKSSNKIAADIGFSGSTVNRFLRENNLSIPKELSQKFRVQDQKGKTKLSHEQDQFLKDNYLTIPIKVMAKKFKVSHGCVITRLRQLNIKIPREIAEARKKKGQFVSGQVSHNRGKKLSDYMTPKQMKGIKKNQFKRGHLPHNTIFEDGAIARRRDTKTGRIYLYKKIDHSNWVLLNRYVWEQANGPIPPDMVIIMKNGNSEDCRLQNLKAITKRENAIRNTEMYNAYPEELKEAIKLNNKLIKTTI